MYFHLQKANSQRNQDFLQKVEDAALRHSFASKWKPENRRLSLERSSARTIEQSRARALKHSSALALERLTYCNLLTANVLAKVSHCIMSMTSLFTESKDRRRKRTKRNGNAERPKPKRETRTQNDQTQNDQTPKPPKTRKPTNRR